MTFDVTLSFCIATRNRASLIGLTLHSILTQITDECEIVVVDGASTDGTDSVMKELCDQNRSIRYFRQEFNGGVDQDFDRAVALARGRYCWLLPDDDLLAPDAVGTVLSTLRTDYGLILVNVEHRDCITWRVLSPSMITSSHDIWFSPNDLSRTFEETSELVSYIGCIVVSRSLWISRDRSRYYGSEFIHVGVIFSSPIQNGIYLVAKPLVSIRCGNQQWIPRSFYIWVIKWPTLVASLPLSESAKGKVVRDEALWRYFFNLLFFRGNCAYSTAEYLEYIRIKKVSSLHRAIAYTVAITPTLVANTCCMFLSLLQDSRTRNFGLAFLRRSPACGRWWRLVGPE